MIYFTSDLHLGEERIGVNGKPNLLNRPFKSIDEQNKIILENLSSIKNSDILYIVGDLLYSNKYEYLLEFLPNCYKILIMGNYDEDKLEILRQYFDEISDLKIIDLKNHKVYINHYPVKCLDALNTNENIDFTITAHIHSLWRVQKDMINVSTDAWHFKPVSEEQILFLYDAMINHYDENVFPYIKK